MSNVRIPWFRVHATVLNDPGRILSVHIMHTALVAGWSGTMAGYERSILDGSDSIYNPLWRQGSYVFPFMTRIGINDSAAGWSIGTTAAYNVADYETGLGAWTYESVIVAHWILSGALYLAALWHWAYWDLNMFIDSTSGQLVLDFLKLFGIHLTLASLLCFGFGYFHLTGTLGPGMWASDQYAIVGGIRDVQPAYSLFYVQCARYGSMASHHIVAGLFGLAASLWHCYARPTPNLYGALRMGRIESVLSTSIIAVLWAGVINAASMWYGSVTTPVELFGTTRYHWDNGYFAIEIDRRHKKLSAQRDLYAWWQIPEKLLFYDFLGNNPAKGGLFRSGPMIKGDGVCLHWIGHVQYKYLKYSARASNGDSNAAKWSVMMLSVRRMPAFFETFPVLLVDRGGTVRADIPFRRNMSRYSIEQIGVQVEVVGGVDHGTLSAAPSLVKYFARRSQFGELFLFNRYYAKSDGLWRTSSRGWFSFAHLFLSSLFLLAHLWHAARTFFADIWTGVTVELVRESEFGVNVKLGDSSS
jgi:photosystem II CP47 chlorophyll apoprotein